MTLIVIFFLSLSFSIVITPMLIDYLKSRGIVDKPDKRRVHTVITPRMGGIVIFSILLLLLFTFYTDLNHVRIFIIGLLIISTIGIVDDIVGLKWYYKFFFQTLTALLIIYDLNIYSVSVEMFFLNFNGILGFLLLLLFIVGLINAINLMDGLDGLVAGYSVIIFITFFGLSYYNHDYFLNLVIVSVIGSLLGVLKYNANPASIFLGDVGSLTLGYLIAYIVLRLARNLYLSNDSTLDLTFPIILLSVPILDTLKVLFTRLIKKNHPFKPDKLHLHHIIIERKLKQKTAVFIIHIFAIAFIFNSIIYLKYSKILGVIIWASFALVLFNTKSILHFVIEKMSISSALTNVLVGPSRVVNRMKNYLIFISLIPLVCVIIESLHFSKSYNTGMNIFFLISSIIVLFVALLFTKIKNWDVNIYVFLNIFFFYIIIFYLKGDRIVMLFANNNIFLLSIISIVGLITIFSVTRRKVIPANTILFNGIDLVLIVITMTLFLLKNMLSFEEMNLVSYSAFIALILYLWIKIVLSLKSQFRNMIFYVSFLFPIGMSIIYLFE